MSVGSDGFTDCNAVCNPDNDMAWSCRKYCEGYVYKATPQPAVQSNSSDDTHDVVRIVSACGGILVLAITMLICYCYRHKFYKIIWNLRNKRLPFSTQPANEEAGNQTHHGAGVETGLLASHGGNVEDANQTDILHENASDSGVSLENSSVHTLDEIGTNMENLGADGGLMPGNTEPLSNRTGQQYLQFQLQDNTSNNGGVQDFNNHERVIKKQGDFPLAIGQESGTNYISSARS